MNGKRKKDGKEASLFRIMLILLSMTLSGTPLLFITANLIGIVHGVSFGVNTIMSQQLFDGVTGAVSGHTAVSTVLWLAAALGGVVLASQVLNGVHNFMASVLFKKMSGYLGMRINDKAGKIDAVSYETPALLDDITKAKEGADNSVGLLFTVAVVFTFYLPYFLFMGIYLFTLKPLLALSLVFVFVPVVCTQLIRGAVFTHLADEAAPLRREYEYYEKCLCDREYFKETRILGGFGYFRELYRSSLALLSKKTWSAERRTGLLELGMRMLTLAGYFGILYLLFTSLLGGDITIGAFAAVFASVGMLFSVMEEIVCRHIGGLTKNLGTVRNFIRFMDLPERKGAEAALHAEDGIVLSGVSFCYPGAESNALDCISLEIKKGETVAIVGENGAGKTTLVKLMTGLYLPTGGKVTVGGVDTADVAASSVYGSISAVFQKYQKYKMTLEDNIAISVSAESPDGDLLAAASAKADLAAETEVFPEGYQTMLSREFDGVDISGGQWQRVAIARGFYRAHGMIVLDEPTAAIDPIEETRLYKQFSELSRGKTAIIVTHRLGSAKIADRIIVMDRGRVQAEGSHEELMRSGGLYAEMFNAQSKWYERDEVAAG